MKSLSEKWLKIREPIYLMLLFSYMMCKIYNISVIEMSIYIPHFEAIFEFIEYKIFPLVLILLYLINFYITSKWKETKRVVIEIIIFAVLTLTAFKYRDIFALAVFLLCADFSSVEKIFKYAFGGIALATVCVIIASKTNFSYDHVNPRFGIYAHYFAFGHYALWARQFFFAALAYLFIRGKKAKIAEYLVAFVAYLLIFYYSTQRLTLIVSMFSLVVFLVFVKYELIKINNKLFEVLAAIAFTVATMFSVVIHYFYNPDIAWMSKINGMLSGRLGLGKEAFEIMDIGLFSQHFPDLGRYFYIDSGYLYLLFAFGLIFSIVIIGMYSYIYWRSCKINDTSLFAFLTVTIVYLLVDNTAHNFTCTAIILLAFPILLKEHIEEKKKDLEA